MYNARPRKRREFSMERVYGSGMEDAQGGVGVGVGFEGRERYAGTLLWEGVKMAWCVWMEREKKMPQSYGTFSHL